MANQTPTTRTSSDPGLGVEFALVGVGVLVTLLLILGAVHAGRVEEHRLGEAQRVLHDGYGLTAVADPNPRLFGHHDTLSVFSTRVGQTTHDVPFSRDGKTVFCTVRMPQQDVSSVTADCD